SEEQRAKMLAEARHRVAGTSTPAAAVHGESRLNSLLEKARSADEESPVWEELCLRLMWHHCCQGARSVPLVQPPARQSIRHSELLYQFCGTNPDLMVEEVLVRHCAAYLDQGFSEWRLPGRSDGFLESFIRFYRISALQNQRWMRGLRNELDRLESSGAGPEMWVVDSLQQLGVPEAEWEDYIRATLLSLRGWAGMIWQTEVRPDRVFLPSPQGTLLEFVAVKLLLDRLAVQYVAAENLQWSKSAAALRNHLQTHVPTQGEIRPDQYAYRIFQCAQLLGWGPNVLQSLDRPRWKQLIQELAEFSEIERQRVFHVAFERHFARTALDSISVRVDRPPQKPKTPILQVACCIDAREESFRRYIEEVSPDVETFGAAGFYGIPMYYRGLGDAHFQALCPIVVMPKFWLIEEPVYSMEEIARAKARARKILGTATHRILEETQRSLGGAFVSALLGPLATAPLVGYTVFPGMTARLNTAARYFVSPPQVTRLRLERAENVPPGPKDDQIGFTVTEMAQLGGKLLRDMGLTENFAPIVLFLGHGSACLNNPHTSAYHCGACSGGAGGPNARAVAAMLNDPRVRTILKEQGLDIPAETHFLGGHHNTATDEITFYDLELLPTWHVKRMSEIRDILSRACELNAHERCRRFESAAFDLDVDHAMLHVQDRSNNLAETRPEYGNCTNAMCFVGRRSRIRGLYLDRRSFLQSYDPTQDDEDSKTLAGILSAVVPVCEGINLLYTFSAIDPAGWGAGSKLPHNVTSMLGVMDGAGSDLRPGLPWQGVDIHEPMRLLFVIETTPESMLKIMKGNETIDRICRGGWVQLAVLDPNSSQLMYFSGGRFERYTPTRQSIPEIPTSLNWYCGSRDHLPFAIVNPTAQN
ncbi:MAG: DUF2309 domain-containing protein, partial [Planctomycetaceae bacterium]|nr:DUF2309 domain-containing protein [Planctomycetaceae bacterium]